MPWGSIANGTHGSTGGGRKGGWGSTSSTHEDTSAPKKKDGGGFLGKLGHVLAQTGTDLKDVAYQAPGGIALLAKEFAGANKEAATGHSDKAQKHLSNLETIGKQTVEQIKTDLRHPLRHPGYTLLDILPAVGAAGKAAEAGRLAKAGGTAGEVAKAVVKGTPGEARVLKVGDAEIRGHYSRSAGSRVVQKATDSALQKGAQTNVRVENLLHRRANKWERRNQRVADATARSAGTIVQSLGKKLKPDELRALRLVAEETPVERRLGAQEMRKGRATNAKETARHQERIDVTRAAIAHLTADAEGRPVFKPEATKLKKVYAALERASGDREAILQNLKLMDAEGQQAAKTKVGRLAGGQPLHEGELPLTFDPQTIEHAPEQALRKRLSSVEASYQKLVESAMGGKPGDYRSVTALQNGRLRKAGHATVRDQLLSDAEKTIQAAMDRNPDHPTVKAWRGKLADAEAIRAELQRRGDVSIGLEAPRALPEAQKLFTPSEKAVFIGNPVERTKLRGKPRVSSGGTFGHTQKPSSLKQMTGGAVEHALERGDVTNIVGERHAEAVRLAKVDRVVQKFKAAGDKVPRRKDDVWMWTDKTVSNERIPKDVRAYLDNPDSIAQLLPDEQVSVFDKIREATFEEHNWKVDAEKRAAFEKLAAEGKGVFVPQRLLGQFAAKDYTLGNLPGIKFFDAVNNAQKAGLIYLKLNYPVVQGVSNVAMNLIQQGFAYPRNLSAAIRLENKVGAEYAAITDDIMGQGAVLQAQFEGQGVVSRASQKLAHVMSSKVDTPARRAAFYHEAVKAGFDTPDKYRALLEDDRFAGDLGEVAQRAKEAIVDYGDMSPFEKSVVRRLVFVYPWQKGATKYAGHFLRDHPVQAAALSQIGQQGKAESDAIFGAVPSYLDGLIPVDGKAVNPAGANFFQTPAQIGTAVGGLITGNPAQASAGQGFLGPAPATLAGLLSGHDDIGRPLKGNIGAKVRDLTYGQTPIAQVGRALLADKSDTARKLLGSRTSSKTFPDSNDAFWRFLFGGLYPRQVDRGALNSNAAREKTGR